MSDPWDPFTAAHQAIFAAIANNPPLAALVLPGNRVNTTDANFAQFKSGVAAGDTPQIKLLQDDFVLAPFGGNSAAAVFSQSYRVLFTIDLLRVVTLNQLKFQMLRALVKAGSNLGLPFVKEFEVGPGKDQIGLPKEEAQRSQRWVAAFEIKVTMYLSRALLNAQ